MLSDDKFQIFIKDTLKLMMNYGKADEGDAAKLSLVVTIVNCSVMTDNL